MENNYKKAVLFLLIASLSFAIMTLMVRLAGKIPVFEKVMFRKFITLLVSLFLILRNGDSIWGKKANRPLLILRGLAGFIGVSLYFYSINNLSLSDGTMLNKLSPFFVIIFAAYLLKEKLKKHQIIAICIAFLASLLIIKPKFDIVVIPAIAGFSSAIFAGFAYALIRLINTKGEKSTTIVFYFSLVAFIASIPLVAGNFVMPHGLQWLYLTGIGLFAGIGQLFMTEAYRYAKASSIAPYQYMHVLFSALISIFILQEFPDIWSIIGSLIIVSAFIFLYKKESVK